MINYFFDNYIGLFLEKNYSIFITEWLKVKDAIISSRNKEGTPYRQILRAVAEAYFEVGNITEAAFYFKMLIEYYLKNNISKDIDYVQSLGFYYVCNKHRNIFFRYKLLIELFNYDEVYKIEKNKIEERLLTSYTNKILMLICLLFLIVIGKVFLVNYYNLEFPIVFSWVLNILLIYCVLSLFIKKMNEKLLINLASNIPLAWVI